MDFGKSFKFYRERANLTQKEAAQKMGIKDYQLGNYETNRSQPSLEVLRKMSRTYKVSIDKMLGNNMLANNLGVIPMEERKDYIDVNELLARLNEIVEKADKK